MEILIMKLVKFFVLGAVLLFGNSYVSNTVFADPKTSAKTGKHTSVSIKSKFRITLSGRDFHITKKFPDKATVRDLKTEIERVNGWEKGRILGIIGLESDDALLSDYKWPKDKVFRVIIEAEK